MKQKKTIALFCVMAGLAVVSGLSGCHASSQKLTEYTPANGMYSLSLPGEWKTEDDQGMDYSLDLTRSDGMEISTVGIPKQQEASNIKNLDDYIKVYENSMTSSGFSMEKKKTEDLTMDGMKACKGYMATMTETDNNQKLKVYIMYAESDDAYYTVAFSSTVGFKTQFKKLKGKVTIKELDVPTTTETMQWFNSTYALLTLDNGGNVNLVGGWQADPSIETAMKQTLNRSRSIKSHSDADDTYNWLISEGHNKEALDELNAMGAEQMTPEEFSKALDAEKLSAEDKTKLQAAYDAYATYGDQAIKAWDYSRAMSVLAYCYLADYYTYDEAMDQSMGTAAQIQKTFSSWDDFIGSYLLGYLYWSGDDPKDPTSQYAKRKSDYEKLKAEKDGPYSVDWNLKFEKDW